MTHKSDTALYKLSSRLKGKGHKEFTAIEFLLLIFLADYDDEKELQECRELAAGEYLELIGDMKRRVTDLEKRFAWNTNFNELPDDLMEKVLVLFGSMSLYVGLKTVLEVRQYRANFGSYSITAWAPTLKGSDFKDE